MRTTRAITLGTALLLGVATAHAQPAPGEPDAPDVSEAPTGQGQDVVAPAGVPVPAGEDGTTTTSAAPAPAPVAETGEPMDAGTYAVRLRDLEQRINELKEQIFRSKARLSLLAETVLQSVVAGSQVVIAHENRMSSSYRLVRAVYALDGAPVFNRADEDGSLAEQDAFDVYNGNIVPGEHSVTVNLEYRGHGYGIFSYLKGYRFKVRSSYTFTAPEGRRVTLRVVAYEKGGPTAPLEERPAVRYQERVEQRMSASAATDADGAAAEESAAAESDAE